MFGGALVSILSLLPLVAIIVVLVLLKRISDGIERLNSTVDRRLLQIQQAIAGPGLDEGRWPPEA